jgi:actin-like ATPase involved in cell morphogenesis
MAESSSGGWRQPGRILAIDLGSTQTRVLVPDQGIVLEEPTLIASNSRGDVVAAGRDAWVASKTNSVSLRAPVRGGVVRDPIACVHLVTRLIRKAGVRSPEGRDIAVCLPATATAQDASVLTGVIASATGGRVVTVESSLAALIGSLEDLSAARPRAVCDLGAGVTEVGVIAEGRVLATSAVRRTVNAEDDPHRVTQQAHRLFERAMTDLPTRVASEIVGSHLLLVGGGTSWPGIEASLSLQLQMPVQVPDDARDVLVKGLGAWVGDRRAMVRT